MNSKISVIVPVYNAEEYLYRCINSIREQSLEEIEILLVDDGSTDNSGAICDEYALVDERIKVIHQENRGPIGARKQGVIHAQSPYIVFVDADDFIEKYAYEIALPDMEKEIDIISFGIIRYYAEFYKRIDAHSYIEGIYKKEQIREYIFPTMIWDKKKNNFGLDPSLCTKVIKKELLEKSYQRMGEYSFHYGEDPAAFYPLMLEANSISIHKESFYNHRQRIGEQQPPYIGDKKYFDKLYQLYTFLRTVFEDEIQLMEQIEQYYIYSVLIKQRKEERTLITFLFPFDKVEKGARIVIYGAGNVGKDYMKQLLQMDYCEVVLWVDNNYENLTDERVFNPETLYQTDYDKVVIAIMNNSVKQDVKKHLMERGVLESDII